MTATRAVVIPASSGEVMHEGSVFAFLQSYFSVLAQGEIEKLVAYHPTLFPEQLNALRHYFAPTIRDLRIRLDHVQVKMVANSATVEFFRTDTFVDRPTNRQVEKSVQLSTALIQSADGWRLAGIDQIAFALVGNPSRMKS